MKDNNVLLVDTDDFQSGEMFTGLRLRTRFVSGNEQEGTVHYWSVTWPDGTDDLNLLTAAPVNMVAMRMS